MSTNSSTPENIIIEPRRPDFDFSDTTKYWLRDPFTSHFIYALSIVVPSFLTVISWYRQRINPIKKDFSMPVYCQSPDFKR